MHASDRIAIEKSWRAIDRTLALLRAPYWPAEWFRVPSQAEIAERERRDTSASPSGTGGDLEVPGVGPDASRS